MSKRSRDQIETALHIVSNVETIIRVRPPKTLRGEQRAAFERTVESVPSDWFTPSNIPTLTQYARHLVTAEKVDEAIEVCIASGDLAQLENLLKVQRAESKVILSLATSLRLTPRSTQPKNVSIKRLNTIKSPWRGGTWQQLPPKDEDAD